MHLLHLIVQFRRDAVIVSVLIFTTGAKTNYTNQTKTNYNPKSTIRWDVYTQKRTIQLRSLSIDFTNTCAFGVKVKFTNQVYQKWSLVISQDVSFKCNTPRRQTLISAEIKWFSREKGRHRKHLIGCKKTGNILGPSWPIIFHPIKKKTTKLVCKLVMLNLNALIRLCISHIDYRFYGSGMRIQKKCTVWRQQIRTIKPIARDTNSKRTWPFDCGGSASRC